MTLTFDPMTFTVDLENLQRIACDMINLCTKFERNRAILGGVIALLVFDLITLNIALCVVLATHNGRPSTTYTCLSYSVFLLIRYVTL